MLGSRNDVAGSTMGDGIGSVATLEEAAGITGGRPDAGKDVDAAVKQAMADVRTSYRLANHPLSSKRDGKLHKLRVISSGKGVRLETRTGYYAPVLLPGGETRQAIDSLVATKFDAAEIGLTAGLSLDSVKGRHSVQSEHYFERGC